MSERLFDIRYLKKKSSPKGRAVPNEEEQRSRDTWWNRGVDIALVLATLFLGGIATYQAYLSRGSSHKELRPYIAIEVRTDSLRTNPDGVTEIPVGRDIEFLISNVGQTPAYNVMVVADYGALDATRDTTNPNDIDNTGIFPEPVITKSVLRKKKLESKRVLVVRNPKLVFWRRVTYRDTFGDQHKMTFCFQYFTTQKRFFPYPPELNEEYY